MNLRAALLPALLFPHAVEPAVSLKSNPPEFRRQISIAGPWLVNNRQQTPQKRLPITAELLARIGRSSTSRARTTLGFGQRLSARFSACYASANSLWTAISTHGPLLRRTVLLALGGSPDPQSRYNTSTPACVWIGARGSPTSSC